MKHFTPLIISFVTILAILTAPTYSQDVSTGQFNNSSCFYIKQKPEFPMFVFEQEICPADAKSFSDADFSLYSSIELINFLDLGWKADGVFDFSLLDKVLKNFDQRMPQGRYLMPRIHVWAPEWWIDTHPDQAVGYQIQPSDYFFKPGDGPKHESFASELWKQQAGEGLRQLVHHIMTGPYANRVMGIHIGCGLYGEWHAYDPQHFPDSSEPMLQYFRKYLRTKYNNDLSALKQAWNAPDITFDSAQHPTLNQRTTAQLGIFHDSSNKHISDYYEAFHLATVDAIDHFCKIVKEESNNELLTCVLYGYQPDMPYMPQTIDHRAAAKAHRLSSVDMIASPHSYRRRGLGKDATFRNFPESVQLHNKLFIDEADERTHIAPPGTSAVFVSDMAGSLSVLNRAFGNVVTQGVGMWYMDHSSGAWYNDPTIKGNFVNIKRWADASMFMPRERIKDVALICSLESEFYITDSSQVSPQFYLTQVNQLTKAGAPFNRYLIEDLAAGLVPEHKVYIFIDCFHMTATQKTAIENLKQNNHTLVWLYAPGFADDSGLSLDSIKSLTEIDLAQQNDSFDYVYVNNTIFPNAPSQYRAYEFAGTRTLSPRFIPNDSACQVWGTYSDNQPALVTKDMTNWTSIYSATSNVPWTILNRIYTEAGIHLYSQSGDNLMANNSWVGLHAASDGTKTIKLPTPSPVFDIINNQLIGYDLTEFNIQMQRGDTALFTTALPVGQNLYWRNTNSNHLWSDSANWAGGLAPIAIPQNIVFHGHANGLNNYALIDESLTNIGNAQAIDITMGPDGYDTHIIQTGGTFKFRNLFMSVHDKEVHTLYEMNAGTIKSYFDGNYGGKIMMGFNTNPSSTSTFIQNDGLVQLARCLEIGIASPAEYKLYGGTLEVPDIAILDNGKIDFKDGTLILNSDVTFRQYVNQGKITAYGQTVSDQDFDYCLTNDKYHITYSYLKADLNNDDIVDVKDLMIMSKEWLTTKE